MSKIAEDISTWRIDRTDPRIISLSGKIEDMSILAHRLKVLEKANAIGGVYILKVKGFPLSEFKVTYEHTEPEGGSLNESFDVHCKFEEDRGDVVKYSARQKEFPIGSIVP